MAFETSVIDVHKKQKRRTGKRWQGRVWLGDKYTTKGFDERGDAEAWAMKTSDDLGQGETLPNYGSMTKLQLAALLNDQMEVMSLVQQRVGAILNAWGKK